jgi:hypothetical protein
MFIKINARTVFIINEISKKIFLRVLVLDGCGTNSQYKDRNNLLEAVLVAVCLIEHSVATHRVLQVARECG